MNDTLLSLPLYACRIDFARYFGGVKRKDDGTLDSVEAFRMDFKLQDRSFFRSVRVLSICLYIEPNSFTNVSVVRISRERL